MGVFLFFPLEGPAAFHYEPEENKNVFMTESVEKLEPVLLAPGCFSLILHINFYLFLLQFVSKASPASFFILFVSPGSFFSIMSHIGAGIH